MNTKIGEFVKQKEGFPAFSPARFPFKGEVPFDENTHKLHAEAMLLLGKLDGITLLLPDLDFFIFMYLRKEAALSSQIEGTVATMIDSIKADANLTKELPKDVDDILHYIKAMNYGLKRLQEFPLSLRFIREVHKMLMDGGRSSHHSYPGEFRNSQNWIGGASPQTARFVPPPVPQMNLALEDFEKFLHSDDSRFLPLVKAALAHAQFETIHPFLDGNGRTGRLLTIFLLCSQNILERPVLYLSEYLNKHRQLYFDLLDEYSRKGEITRWLNFFFIGVATVAREAIETSKKVTELREQDIIRIQQLGRTAKVGMVLLQNLYKLPIVNVRKVEEWTSLSRVNANNLVRKFEDNGILEQQDKEVEYGRIFHYKKYLSLFT